jgi:uncharacterized protein
MTLRDFDRTAVGIGFRKDAYAETMAVIDEIEVLEVTLDHWILGSDETRSMIGAASERVPIVAHGVGLSIGTATPPDERYLEQVAAFIDEVDAPWYSEHLAFTKVPGTDLAQLIPVPRTRAMAEILVENIEAVKRQIDVPIVLENISYYFDWPTAEFTEPEFLDLVLGETNSYLLLDLENLYLNARNHGFDPMDFLHEIRPELVRAVHVAGGVVHGSLLLDSHDRPVPEAVLSLFDILLGKATPDSAIIERDQDLDRFEEVVEDLRKVKGVVASAHARR